MNAFEKFKAGKYPQEIQNSIAHFAECGRKYNETDSEYWFRAGFLAREYALNEGMIMVRKEELNLEWYKKTKQVIAEEEEEI